jgi:MscS family membrane protein
MVMEIVEMMDAYIINDYIRAVVIFMSLAVLFRILLFIGRNVIFFFTKKTKTDLDDILIDRLSFPLTVLAILFALAISVNVLVLEKMTAFIIHGLIYSVAILVVARIAYLVVNLLVISGLKRVAKKSKIKMDDTLFHMFNSLLNAVLIVFSVLYIMNIWGIEIGPLLAGLGIAGLAVALALQPILSNIFSGAAIIMDGSVKVGDLVYLEGESIKGRIEKIGLRSTRMRSFDNEYFIIPNNKLSDSAIQNVALPNPKVRVVVPFGVAYGSDVKKVKDIVRAEIKKVKDIAKDEEIIIRFLEMADSSLNFKVFFYVNSFENRASAVDQTNTRIYNVLNKAGIEIPFPQMDVNLKR